MTGTRIVTTRYHLPQTQKDPSREQVKFCGVAAGTTKLIICEQLTALMTNLMSLKIGRDLGVLKTKIIDLNFIILVIFLFSNQR